MMIKKKLKNPNFSWSLNNVDDYMYTADIYMGSNKQIFTVQVDTGSNKLILFDSDCSSCTTTARFFRNQSTTFQTSRVTDSISYLDGSSVSGFKVRDSCSLDQEGNYKAQSFNFLLTFD